MNTAGSESLLDEADFLAELASLENGLPEKRRSPLALPESALPPPAPMAEAYVDVDDAEDDDSPVLGRFAAAGIFVLMVGVGAASAVLVFHERVARILAALM